VPDSIRLRGLQTRQIRISTMVSMKGSWAEFDASHSRQEGISVSRAGCIILAEKKAISNYEH
jgi:hypothetical protein